MATVILPNIYPEKIDDNFVISFFTSESGETVKGRFKPGVIRKYAGLKEYLDARFPDSGSYAETVYRIRNGVESKPACPVCGGPLPYYRSGFSPFCSRECYRKSGEPNAKRKSTCMERYGCENPSQVSSVKEKKKETCLLHYGVEHYSKTTEFVQRVKATCKERYGESSYAKTPGFRKRYAETCMARYGENHHSKTKESRERAKENCVFRTESFKEKAKATCIERYGAEHFQSTQIYGEKVKSTCMERYGCEYVSQTDAFKEKTRKTCAERYGTPYYFQSEDFRKKTEPVKGVLYAKAAATKKLRGTFNASAEEETVYGMLRNEFGEVLRQYRSEKYPFACDFYIPATDTYIEYNGSWTHGKHPFDIEKDSEVLAAWITKRSDYYTNAVKVWTERDPLKRATAKSNNLNFIELWSVAEAEALIKNKREPDDSLSII